MSQAHAFLVENATLYGIECAILINHFKFWIEQNQSMNKNFHDGRTWMYQTQEEIAAIYPYMNRAKIQACIQKLVDNKILIRGNYNRSSFDKTTWYAFENQKMFSKVGIPTIDDNDPNNGRSEFQQPIPDTNTNTKHILKTTTTRERETAKKPEEESPPDKVVVVSDIDCPFKGLKISQKGKIQLMSQYGKEDVLLAVKRTLKFSARICDEAALISILRKKDEWKDVVTPEERQSYKENYLNSLKPLDGTIIKNTRIDVGPTYISFISGPKVQSYDCKDFDFKTNVDDKLKELEINLK